MNRMSSGTSRPTGINNTYEVPTHANKETLPQKGTVDKLKNFWETKAKSNAQTQPGEARAALKLRTEAYFSSLCEVRESLNALYDEANKALRDGQRTNESLRFDNLFNEIACLLDEAILKANNDDLEAALILLGDAEQRLPEALNQLKIAIKAQEAPGQ